MCLLKSTQKIQDRKRHSISGVSQTSTVAITKPSVNPRHCQWDVIHQLLGMSQKRVPEIEVANVSDYLNQSRVG
ncbi:hypothetical protein NPIL_170061 [Nephila pilipes]|uniref:Uncharacterized protein n=1 Tax=Nephila pilipes TaxID=299642 RepID=A0A8X6INE6_NEPPI|nr:hypothetical protein NPIL_170061 [Nephila pilipes]